MAVVIEIDDNRAGYKTVVDYVLKHGYEVPSRNGNTLEVEDMIVVLSNPYDALPLGVGRNASAAVGAVEALQLIGGVSNVDLTCAVQPTFERFVEQDTGKRIFHGAYGPRTRAQYSVIAERLKADPDTRQAVVTMWNATLDVDGGHADHPCTLSHTFLIRDGKLNLKTVMRSNDVWWGFAYDAFQFTRVQLTMAHALGLDVGTYTHHAISMHLYEPHWDIAKTLHVPSNFAAPDIGGHIGEYRSWEAAALAARSAIDVINSDMHIARGYWSNSEQWYIDVIRKQLEKNNG